MAEGKSVLDNVPVKDRSFTEAFEDVASKEREPYTEVVGACPKCGAPIYGPPTLTAGQTANITYSCLCNVARKELSDTVSRK